MGEEKLALGVPEAGGPVPIKNIPLILLAVFAAVFILDWAKAVFIPLVLGLLTSYALAPIVDGLERIRIPRALSSAVLLFAIVGGTGVTMFSLREEAASLLETLPAAVQKFQDALNREFTGRDSTIAKVELAAREIERVAQGSAADLPRGVTRVQVEKPRISIRDYVLTNAVGAASAVGQGMIVLFLAYFLLASGNSFRRKWVLLSGPTLSRRRVTVQVLDAIRAQIQRYLSVQLLTSILVGVVCGLGFWAVGLENAAVWGVVAGVLNLVPYLGAIVTTAGTALVAFLQFGSVGMAFVVGSISLVVNTLEGNWLTPWLSSRASSMNAVVLFSGLLFWGWLWGGWGLVLGLPIMMVFKAICDHVEDFKPIGEFMGE